MLDESNKAERNKFVFEVNLNAGPNPNPNPVEVLFEVPAFKSSAYPEIHA